MREQLAKIVEQALEQLKGVGDSAALEQLRAGDLSPLRRCPFILAVKEESNGKFAYDLLSRFGIVSLPKIEVCRSTVRTELILAASDMGACFVPRNMIRPSLTPRQEDALEVLTLGEEACHMIHFGYLKQRYHWSVITDFIRLAREMSGAFSGPEAKK